MTEYLFVSPAAESGTARGPRAAERLVSVNRTPDCGERADFRRHFALDYYARILQGWPIVNCFSVADHGLGAT